MLQQTQVDRVVPRFEAFLERFPDPAALAAAAEDEVVAAWSGLGYYRRARLLHRLAVEVVGGRHAGRLPDSAQELKELPGIGDYTAAAVASLVHGRPEPVLDGNVVRVAARVLLIDDDPRTAERRREVLAWVRELFGRHHPGEVNEALMELGATVCTPVAPACGGCPLAAECEARATGRQQELPRPKPRRASVTLTWVAVCGLDRARRMLVRRVEDGPVLRGTWLPPVVEGGEVGASLGEQLPPGLSWGRVVECGSVDHAITFRRIRVRVVRLELAEGVLGDDAAWRWWRPEDPNLPVSNLAGKVWKSAVQRS